MYEQEALNTKTIHRRKYVIMAKIATSTPSSVALSTNKLENIHNNCTNYTNNVDNTNDTTVLLNTFLIRKKQFRVFYNAGILMWERYQSKKGNAIDFTPNQFPNSIFFLLLFTSPRYIFNCD